MMSEKVLALCPPPSVSACLVTSQWTINDSYPDLKIHLLKNSSFQNVCIFNLFISLRWILVAAREISSVACRILGCCGAQTLFVVRGLWSVQAQ